MEANFWLALACLISLVAGLSTAIVLWVSGMAHPPIWLWAWLVATILIWEIGKRIFK